MDFRKFSPHLSKKTSLDKGRPKLVVSEFVIVLEIEWYIMNFQQGKTELIQFSEKIFLSVYIEQIITGITFLSCLDGIS